MLNIIRAGMYTSVQDGGREGLRQLGISRCGAMDKPALITANLLVGNGANAAALEITLGQVDIQFERDCWFALTGAACEAMLDGDQAPLVPDMPPQPVPLKITVSDITSQKLVRQAADRPRGLLCHLDEMAS